MKTIYLCGFMGCGKSTVGKRLAQTTKRRFVDMDQWIVDHRQMSIPEIFRLEGEPAFREYETEAFRKLSCHSDLIVATGGGALLRQENSGIALSNGGMVVFLDLPFETCYSRIAGDSNRPNASGRTKEELEILYNQRVPLYRAHSSHTVNASASPEKIVERILSISQN